MPTLVVGSKSPDELLPPRPLVANPTTDDGFPVLSVVEAARQFALEVEAGPSPAEQVIRPLGSYSAVPIVSVECIDSLYPGRIKRHYGANREPRLGKP